jgi:acetyltransferase
MLAHELDLALLRGPRDAMRALASVARWRPARVARAALDAPDVRDLLQPGVLPEHESALVLERFGVPFAPHRRATTPEEVAAAAAELGFPVVVKVDGVAHKAREGGVVLDLGSVEDAVDAARRLGGPVLVAAQIERGDEAMCGMTRDPDYGPVLAVGVGGVAVEELDRLTLTAAPLDRETAREVVAEAGVLDSGDVVASTMEALGRLALAHPEIASIDVNPLVLGVDGAVAVDALVVVDETTV